MARSENIYFSTIVNDNLVLKELEDDKNLMF